MMKLFSDKIEKYFYLSLLLLFSVRTNNHELLHEINLCYSKLASEHVDFVVRDYAIVQLVDFFLLLFVQFVVQETSNLNWNVSCFCFIK